MMCQCGFMLVTKWQHSMHCHFELLKKTQYSLRKWYQEVDFRFLIETTVGQVRNVCFPESLNVQGVLSCCASAWKLHLVVEVRRTDAEGIRRCIHSPPFHVLLQHHDVATAKPKHSNVTGYS